MRQEAVRFTATDGIWLEGILMKSFNYTNRLLIMVHGMTGNCFSKRDEIIAKTLGPDRIDVLTFNNRGSEIQKFVRLPDGTKKLVGTAFEEVSECYFDICGAINFALLKGYTEIYLLGHSFGCTKVVYTYNKLLQEQSDLVKYVKAILLLSMVDVVGVVRTKGKKYLPALKAMVKRFPLHVIYREGAISTMSVKTLARYAFEGDDIDFARFGEDENAFEVLNSFSVPLFFRWGNVDEIALMDIPEQVEFVKRKIHNTFLDAGYIDGANHSYNAKEHDLGIQIASFLKRYFIKMG